MFLIPAVNPKIPLCQMFRFFSPCYLQVSTCVMVTAVLPRDEITSYFLINLQIHSSVCSPTLLNVNMWKSAESFSCHRGNHLLSQVTQLGYVFLVTLIVIVS